MENEVSKFEIFLLNRYMASELSGGLHLGKKARSIKDSFLIQKLTWHCMEEVRHAMIWQELIKTLNAPLTNIYDSEGNEYFSHVEDIKDNIDLLVFTHIFELRVPFHFSMHAQWTKNSKIKNILEKLIPEENPHLKWIREYLQEELNKGNLKVKESIKKFSKIEKETYYRDLEKLEKMGNEGKSFVRMIKSKINDFEEDKKWWENEK